MLLRCIITKVRSYADPEIHSVSRCRQHSFEVQLHPFNITIRCWPGDRKRAKRDVLLHNPRENPPYWLLPSLFIHTSKKQRSAAGSLASLATGDPVSAAARSKAAFHTHHTLLAGNPSNENLRDRLTRILVAPYPKHNKLTVRLHHHRLHNHKSRERNIQNHSANP